MNLSPGSLKQTQTQTEEHSIKELTRIPQNVKLQRLVILKSLSTAHSFFVHTPHL